LKIFWCHMPTCKSVLSYYKTCTLNIEELPMRYFLEVC
jgi:hypothetical protein